MKKKKICGHIQHWDDCPDRDKGDSADCDCPFAELSAEI